MCFLLFVFIHDVSCQVLKISALSKMGPDGTSLEMLKIPKTCI